MTVGRAVRLRECPLGLISTDSFLATHVNASRIKERQKGLSFNEKLSAVQLLHFSSDLS